MKNQITFSAWKPLQKNILAVKNLKRLDAKARISLHARSQSFILSFIYLSYCVRVFRDSLLHTVAPLLGANFVTGRRAFVNEGGG